MRYAAAALENLKQDSRFSHARAADLADHGRRAFYGEELRRLGRFLVRCGGTAPTAETLRRTMVGYEQARDAIGRGRDSMSAREFFEAVAAVHGCPTSIPLCPFCATPLSPCGRGVAGEGEMRGFRLALVGGPLPDSDPPLLEIIEQAGGRVVLDATESGERTLPAPFCHERLHADPFEELVRAYFDAIPEVFRRPNDRLYEWLRQEVAGRGVRGLLVRRYLWCDLWHAELPRLRQECSVPVLEWDVVGDAPAAGDLGRLEAFLEMLR